MNRFDWFAVIAAAAITVLLHDTLSATWYVYVVLLKLHWAMVAIALIGWPISNYGSMVIAALFWRWSKARGGWIPPLLFLPVVYAVMLLGDRILIYAFDVPDFDSTLGAPVMIGMLLLPIAVFGYFGTLAFRRAFPATSASPGDDR